MSRADPPIETELKLAISAAALPLLLRRLARWGRARRAQVDSTYYDTDDGRLARRQAALRLRRDGRRWVQTLKTGPADAAFARRGEWELPAPGGRLDPAQFDATPLRKLLGRKDLARLAPRFRTRFLRRRWDVRHDGALIEVALDQGEIEALGVGLRLPILELELELKSGLPTALFALALELHAGDAALALPLLSESKAARGARLAMGIAYAPVKAQADGFAAAARAGAGAAAALRAVIAHGAEVVAANAQGVLASVEPEFVHQARVALRRMRSAARLLRQQAPLPADLAAEIKWLAGVFGTARDADVLAEEMLPQLLQGVPALVPLAPRLHARAGAERRAARAALRAELQGARTARLLLRLMHWAQQPAADQGAPLSELAPRLLRKARRRLLDAGEFLSALSPARRHRVRILAKRLRYALDLLGPAAPKSARQWRTALAGLQDELGTLNDAQTALEVLQRWGPPEPRMALAQWQRRLHAECLPRAEGRLARLG